MRGCVVVFRPGTGDGLLVNTAGRTIRIAPQVRNEPLHGGDIVSYDVAPLSARDPQPAAWNLSVVEKWSARADARISRDVFDTLGFVPAMT